MKVLTAQQMQEVDRLSTDQYQIPSLLLMENAATQTTLAIERKHGNVQGKRILIVCGKGNNGGDGAAIGRQLWMRGALVQLVLLAELESTSGDALTNFQIMKQLAAAGPAITFHEITSSEVWKEFIRLFGRCDLIIDGLFGTGLQRPASGRYAEVISDLNRVSTTQSTPIISVDIPSGLSADRDAIIGPTIQADLTVTFTRPKPANVLPPACYQCGQLVVAPIGSPDSLVAASGATLNLVEPAQIESWLDQTRRTPMSHKGTFGHALLVAGSRGKPGAACLAAEAALRAGVGLVTVGTVSSAQPIIVSHTAEAMTEKLDETNEGTISETAIERILSLAADRDVLALGPGLTTHESTRRLIQTVIRRRSRPTLVDADGLNCLAPWPEDLSGSGVPLVLTPHPGEMARLIQSTNREVLADRVAVAQAFAIKHSVILVLKGNRTLVASPDGQVYINPTGNAGLATAGTGDVLTGMMAGFLAQKPDYPLESVIAAVYLHGLAGDMAAAQIGMRSMTASDVTRHLGEALRQVANCNEL
ncbi:MAG: NAD(P)H-hydrate dehydratase [Acidobacteria bacterium]|nr:NAD(P)H-hydrate dehydratase [Acidobacteriota bacterium]